MKIGDIVKYQNPYDKIIDTVTVVDIKEGYYSGDDAVHLVGKDVNVITRIKNVIHETKNQTPQNK